MLLLTRIKGKIAGNLKKPNSLRKKLTREGRTRWLDIGSLRFDEGFVCVGLAPSSEIPESFAERYIKADILNLDEQGLDNLGQFDLVRMQHVFEHFSCEEGLSLLGACARLIKPDGYLLITVPDLRIHAKAYLHRHSWAQHYLKFAQTRIPSDAPPSFAFSVFAHQYGYSEIDHRGEAHKWCYDYEGLEYQVQRVGAYKNIRKLGLFDPLTEVPFTHNRPAQDACLIAQRE